MRYEFQAADGRTYRGVSYCGDSDSATGRVRGIVEYQPFFPAISRLKGHRVTPGGPWALVMLAPGLLGMALNRAARGGSRTRRWQP